MSYSESPQISGKLRKRVGASLLTLLLALLLGAGALQGCAEAGQAHTAGSAVASGAAAPAPSQAEAEEAIEPSPVAWGRASFDYADVPEYGRTAAATLGEGVPFFADEDFGRGPFEEYGDLDGLGRCGAAFALIGAETMPAEGTNRGGNGDVRPTGFQFDRYKSIPDKLLYNRCHLITWSGVPQGTGSTARNRSKEPHPFVTLM